MILSNIEIQSAMDEGRLVIDPEPAPRAPTQGAPECPYQTSAVDLRLGGEVVVYKGEPSPINLDLTKGSFKELASVMQKCKLTKNQPYTLNPMEFILGQTHETVSLPLSKGADKSLAARVEGKSSFARCGLLVHFTAPTIHAGFSGTITLEIMNLGPYSITLHQEMPICQLIIEEVRGVPFGNPSQFHRQTGAAGTKD